MSSKLNPADPFRVRHYAGGDQVPHVASFAVEECALEFAERCIQRSLRMRSLLLLRVVDVAAQQLVMVFASQGATERATGRFCRVCGCSDEDGCPEGCTWVGEALCSACEGKEKEA